MSLEEQDKQQFRAQSGQRNTGSIDNYGLTSEEPATSSARTQLESTADAALPPDGGLTTEQADPSAALLADHSLMEKGTHSALWPIAVGGVAVVLVVIGGVGAYSERLGLKEEIGDLSEQLLTSRKKVERLIIENARLAAALETTNHVQPAARVETETVGAEKVSRQESEPAKEPGVITSLPIPLNNEPGAASASQSGERVSSSAPQPTLEIGAEPSWNVTVGAFSNQNNAQRLVDNLQRDGLKVSMQPIMRGGKELRQIRVIGLPSEESATQTAQKIEKSYRTGKLSIDFAMAETYQATATYGDAQPNASAGMLTSSMPDSGLSQPADKSLEIGSMTEESANTTRPVGWFIYVDTYSDSNSAHDVANSINQIGFNAKIAVKYQSGNLLYRVQVVGIESREQGEMAIQSLAKLSNMPRLQLRKY